AAVMKEPYDETFGRPEGPSLASENGNVLLDRLFGVEIHLFGDAPWETLWEHAEEVAQSYEAQGLTVFRVPVGGSSPLGAYSFFEASREVEGFDMVIACSSSGSTQTGLAYGFQGTATRLIGIAVDPEEDLFEDMARLSRGLNEIVKNPLSTISVRGEGAGGEGSNRGEMKSTDFDLRFNWVGPGYGIATPEGLEAIRLMARTEGILLDPVYTGKAFAALLDLVGRGEVTGRVLFWHTGGVPSLFAASRLL
nr:pyridoxal-phosphate dependent enzyme [Fimbriimonadaceae bacterium]